jgi:hypothetical protein
VTLRDGRTIAADHVQSVTDQGVALKPGLAGDGTPRALLVPWVEVAEVGLQDASSWGEAEAYRMVADALIRVEMRLSRGDVPGTLRLLGPLSERYLAGSGPTTGLVASALVVCRTLREDPSGAARAWLVWRRTREGPDRDWIDATTGLVPALPPVWTARHGATFLALPTGSLGDSEYATELAALYARAARHATGETMDEELNAPSTRLRADAGVRLVWEMVRAQIDPALSGRREARDALRRRLRSGSPAWEEAWAHLGIGVSLIGEPDPMDADAGAAELVGVIISYRDAAPWLAELAMMLATDYFERTGRPEYAEAVMAMDRAARREMAVGGTGGGEQTNQTINQTINQTSNEPVGTTVDPIEELP